MKKRVLTAANILLGGLIATLGVGCHTQKKAAETQPSPAINSPIMCLYGIPYVEDYPIQEENPDQLVLTPENEQPAPADTVQPQPAEPIQHEHIAVKYGVPAPLKTR